MSGEHETVLTGTGGEPCGDEHAFFPQGISNVCVCGLVRDDAVHSETPIENIAARTDWLFPTPRYHLLDIWVALGLSSTAFEVWIDEDGRTPADAWAQLMAAIRGDLTALSADTNPAAGSLLASLLQGDNQPSVVGVEE